jgi:hypothetical protein
MLGHEQADPVGGVGHDLVERAGRVPDAEVPGPASQEAVDFCDDLFERDQQPGMVREFTDTLPGVPEGST